MSATFKTYNKEADKSLVEISSDIYGDLSSKRCMIMCNQRKVWTSSKERFKNRIEESCMYFLPGSKIFLVKWGLSIKFFKKFFLKSDSKFDGPLDNPNKSLNFFIQLFLCKLNYFYIKFIYSKINIFILKKK